MAKKRTDVMSEDALYVGFITVLSAVLTILGASLAFQG